MKKYIMLKLYKNAQILICKLPELGLNKKIAQKVFSYIKRLTSKSGYYI